MVHARIDTPRAVSSAPAGGWWARALALVGGLLLATAVARAEPLQPPFVDLANATLTPVRLALQWYPQSQFAGYYMAREKGIYRDFGLDVSLLHADATQGSLDLLRAGAADLATAFLADGIRAALGSHDETPPTSAGAEALVLVQVAQLVQRSHLMLVAWREMGVLSPSDLHGRRISHWQGSFSSVFEAFFAQHRIEPLRIPQFDSISLFLERGVAACAAMEYNEYHAIWQSGIDHERLTTVLMREVGLDFPEDGLYATTPWFATHPGIARAVRAATLAGWAYAREHPEETLDQVLREAARAGVPANRPHQRWMLEQLLEGIFPADDAPAGVLAPEAFTRTAQALLAAGLIARIPDFATFAPLEGRVP